MQDTILEFIDGLKFRGVSVSLSETMDALSGVSEMGIDDRGTFRTTLKSTLIKDVRDLDIFDELFDAYFARPLLIDQVVQMTADDVSRLLDEFSDDVSDELSGLLSGDPKTMMELLMEAAQQANISDIRHAIQVGYFFTRMSGSLAQMGLDRQMNELIDLLRQQGRLGNGEEGADEEGLRRLFEERQEQLRELARDMIKREQKKHQGDKKEQEAPTDFEGRSFSQLTAQEIEEMRDVISALVKKIKDALSLRERRVRRGRFDIKKTLRISQQYGGVPIKVFFKRRKKNKAQIVTLCDVSRSVWNASRFMLNLLYSLQDQFDRVRSFVFVSDVGEVTDVFKRYEVNEALGRLMFEAGINFYSYTDYGDVLLKFYREYLDIINRRTTVIIIGDARNNYMAHNSWVMDKIKGKARKVYWLNPEPESWWGTGDSEMNEYLPYTSEARECRNFKQLLAFIHDLIV